MDHFVRHVREAVRAESVYRVPTHDDISVKLNQNECPYDIPVPVKHLLVQHIAESHWNRYPSEFADALRDRLAASVGLTKDSVILGNGSNELAQFLGHSLIEAGKPVVVLDPMFSLFQKIVRLSNGVPVIVGCEPDFTTDPNRILEAARASDAGLVIVASPNNPTGKAIAIHELAGIAAGIEGLLLIDEAYHEFVEGPDAASLLGDHPNVIVMRTFSKTLGLAGLRLGYLMAHPQIVTELMKARLPFMINRLTDIVATYLIDHPEIARERVRALRDEREKLLESLRRLPGVDVVPSSTNFLIFQTRLEAKALETALADRGVLIRDVSGYKSLPRFVRVNVGLPAENKAFLSALNDVLFRVGEEAT